MKQIEYSLTKNDGVFGPVEYWLTARYWLGNNVGEMACPYSNKGDDEVVPCGSWCPLFEVGEEEDGKVEVTLNCGRGRELLAKDETGE